MNFGDSSRGIKTAIACLLLAGVLCWAGGAAAQSGDSLIRSQAEALKRLPPAERKAAMEALGLDPALLSDEAAAPEFPETVLRSQPTDEAEDEPRLGPGDTLILTLGIPEELPDEERNELEAQLAADTSLSRLLGSTPRKLDPKGVLELPGVARIPLAGLSAEEAAQRVEAEEALKVFEAQVVILPLAASGKDALERFGYDLFEGVPLTFAPATDVPVPAEYVIGPGDTINLQLFGNVNARYDLVVSRDGRVNIPEIGPVTVAGMSFESMRDELGTRIREQMIGVTPSITMGELRSIRIFVLGDVNRPGSFTVSALSTMTNALFVSGGVSETGSLRRVQLKRDGSLVQELDLYDLLLRGDNSGDRRLQPNDVIFIPPLGPAVGIAGEVRRPAIYELAGETTVGQIVGLAGGLLPTAYPASVRLERIDDGLRRSLLTLDLTTADARGTRVRDGDVLYIDPVLDRLEDSVLLSGHVYREGPYQWYPGMRISELVSSMSQLKPQADPHYLLVRREPVPGGPIEVLSADLSDAHARRGGPADLVLQERDQVIVLHLTTGRRNRVDELIEELRLQAVFGRPRQEATVRGRVRAPGTYPLEEGMRLSDLLRAGANLSESAYGLEAELTRYAIVGGQARTSEILEIDLASVLAGDAAADIPLQPHDFLNIKEVPLWREQWEVEISGEVNFPGTYPISPGDTLSDVLDRAGGLTEFAFPEGSVFLREELKERESKQLKRLANRLEQELATLTVQAARASGQAAPTAALSVGQTLLSELESVEPTGRLVIDLPRVLSAPGRARHDVVLKDGDRLVIPERRQEVTVIGEVQYATSHLFSEDLGRDDYIGQSGGLTANADSERIYIVKANGVVVAGNGGSSLWFRSGGGTGVEPGDTIVVPLDVDRLPKLALWQTSTSIVYNLAIAAAAIGSL